MLFSKNLFAALLAVAAVGVNGSPVELKKRQILDTILVCPDDFDSRPTQTCGTYNFAAEECIELGQGVNDTANSVVISPGLTCDFHPDPGCSGPWVWIVPVAVDVPEELAASFPEGWNDAASSFMCHRT